MGDSTFWWRVLDLARAATPLVTVNVPPALPPNDDRVLPEGVVTITAAGRDTLRGRADWIHLDGFDRWLGGVHLSAPLGGDVAWRYDPATSRLVRTG